MTRRYQPPERFARIKPGLFVSGHGPVRLSTAARKLREQGLESSAQELERDAKSAASWCPQCERALPDPAIGLLGDRVAFACPWCSGPELLALWEAEGETHVEGE